jgi:hypothetical protein
MGGSYKRSVLQADRDRKRKSIHETRKRGAFLRHFNEDLARSSLFVHPDNDVALVTPNRELVRDGFPFIRQLTPLGTGEQVPLFRRLGAYRFFLFFSPCAGYAPAATAKAAKSSATICSSTPSGMIKRLRQRRLRRRQE